MTAPTTTRPTAPPSRAALTAVVALAAAGPLAIGALRAVLPYSTVDDPSTIAEKVAADPGAQAAVLGLAYLALLTLPLGVLLVARVAAAARPVLGMIAGTVAWIGVVSLFAGVGPDAIAYAGALADVPASTVADMIVALDGDPLTGLPILVYVAGHILGVVLLGIALWRVVPRWAALALIVSQPLHLVFAVVAPHRVLDALAWGLTAVGFAMAAGAHSRRNTVS